MLLLVGEVFIILEEWISAIGKGSFYRLLIGKFKVINLRLEIDLNMVIRQINKLSFAVYFK